MQRVSRSTLREFHSLIETQDLVVGPWHRRVRRVLGWLSLGPSWLLYAVTLGPSLLLFGSSVLARWSAILFLPVLVTVTLGIFQNTRNTSSYRDGQGRRIELRIISTNPTPVIFWGSCLAIFGAPPLLRLSRQLWSKSAKEVLEEDHRAVVLYLRSFKSDRVAWFTRWMDLESFEENLTSVLGELGPVIAIGHPNEILPPVGAARVYATLTDWQDLVHKALETATIVVLQPEASPGFLWELRAVAEQFNPEGVVVALEPTGWWGRGQAQRRYDVFRDRARGVLPYPLPPFEPTLRFVTFDESWIPTAVHDARELLLVGQPRRSSASLRESLRTVGEQRNWLLNHGRTLLAAVMMWLWAVVVGSHITYLAWSSVHPRASPGDLQELPPESYPLRKGPD